MSAAHAAPIVGEPLPRAGDAYTAPEKLKWILAEDGHGREWRRVLSIASDDSERLWRAIVTGVLRAPVSAIRDLGPFGVGCEVRVLLTLNARSVSVITAWHYERAGDPPRLITAYPTP